MASFLLTFPEVTNAIAAIGGALGCTFQALHAYFKRIYEDVTPEVSWLSEEWEEHRFNWHHFRSSHNDRHLHTLVAELFTVVTAVFTWKHKLRSRKLLCFSDNLAKTAQAKKKCEKIKAGNQVSWLSEEWEEHRFNWHHFRSSHNDRHLHTLVAELFTVVTAVFTWKHKLRSRKLLCFSDNLAKTAQAKKKCKKIKAGNQVSWLSEEWEEHRFNWHHFRSSHNDRHLHTLVAELFTVVTAVFTWKHKLRSQKLLCFSDNLAKTAQAKKKCEKIKAGNQVSWLSEEWEEHRFNWHHFRSSHNDRHLHTLVAELFTVVTAVFTWKHKLRSRKLLCFSDNLAKTAQAKKKCEKIKAGNQVSWLSEEWEEHRFNWHHFRSSHNDRHLHTLVAELFTVVTAVFTWKHKLRSRKLLCFSDNLAKTAQAKKKCEKIKAGNQVSWLSEEWEEHRFNWHHFRSSHNDRHLHTLVAELFTVVTAVFTWKHKLRSRKLLCFSDNLAKTAQAKKKCEKIKAGNQVSWLSEEWEEHRFNWHHFRSSHNDRHLHTLVAELFTVVTAVFTWKHKLRSRKLLCFSDNLAKTAQAKKKCEKIKAGNQVSWLSEEWEEHRFNWHHFRSSHNDRHLHTLVAELFTVVTAVFTWKHKLRSRKLLCFSDNLAKTAQAKKKCEKIKAGNQVSWLSEEWEEHRFNWHHFRSSHNDRHLHTLVAELFTVVTAVFTWKHKLRSRKLLCFSDNLAKTAQAKKKCEKIKAGNQVSWLSEEWEEHRFNWHHFRSSHNDRHLHTLVAELFTVVTAVFTWKHKLRSRKLLCFSDNLAKTAQAKKKCEKIKAGNQVSWLSEEWEEHRFNWHHFRSSHNDRHLHTLVAELFTVVTAVFTWKHKLRSQKLLCFSDNLAVMGLINSFTSEPLKPDTCKNSLDYLIHTLQTTCRDYSIKLQATWLDRQENWLADHLSRSDVAAFRAAVPEAAVNKTKAKKLSIREGKCT